ncbi:MAG: MFS transporter, partial [Chloroflexi bacterium]
MQMLLRKRSFALLWFGGLISIMGDRVLAVALPFFIYQQTRSTLVTAILVAATLIPRILLGSTAGVLVDRWDRKRIMVVTSLGQGLILLPLLLVDSSAAVWIAYLVRFCQTVLAIFFGPAETALLPQLVEKDQLLPANALNTLNNNIARLIGPPLGGVILAAVGLPGVVLFDSLTFLVAAGMIAGIRLPVNPAPAPAARPAPGRYRREWLEGMALIWKDRGVTMLF